jgi:hypothetical protein
MRRLALLAAAALAAAPALADDLQQITLTVGEKRSVGGNTPICDDPGVAVISRDGAGILEAKGPGETTCSIASVGNRRVFRVKVLAKSPGGASGQGGSGGQKRSR